MGWTIKLIDGSGNSYPVYLPDPAYEAALRNDSTVEFWGKALSYTCPRGHGIGVAWLLMDRLSIEGLSKSALHHIEITGDYGEVTLYNFVVVSAMCVSNTRGSDDDSLYLVELQDVRALLTQDDASQWYDDGQSWADAWTAIWANLNATYRGAKPDLPISPDGNPNNLGWVDYSAWDAACEFLHAAGCEIVYNPTVQTNQFSVVEIGAAQTNGGYSLAQWQSQYRDRLIFDWDPSQNLTLADSTTDLETNRLRQYYSGVIADVLPGSELTTVRWRYYRAEGRNGGLVTEWHQAPLRQPEHTVATRTCPAVLQGDLDSGSYATAKLYYHNPDDGDEDFKDLDVYDDTMTVYDWLLPDYVTIPSGNFVFATQCLDGRWYVSNWLPQADRCAAVLKGALDSGDATATVDNVTPLNGSSPVDAAADELTAQNVHGWDGDDNAACKIEWNQTEERWELYQVTCPS